jgi:hypothetical protein
VLSRLRHRVTYANVAATLALVFAMGGSAVAATHYLITSSKQISPKVLKELKKPGAKGAAGPAGAAGPQGPAGASGTAGATGTAGANGTNGAPGTNGAQGPEGKPSGNAPHWRTTIAKAAGETALTGAQTTLFEAAPFKITGRCWKGTTGEDFAATYIETSEEGSFAAQSEEGEQLNLKVGTPLPLSPEPAEGTFGEAGEEQFRGPNNGLFSAASKTGAVALDGAANEGVFIQGTKEPACSFSGFVVLD